MTGTRVIYPESAPGVTLQLSNGDDFPYLVQIWLDAGREDSAPDDTDEVPFLLSPPVFRIEPQRGQAVRLMLTDGEHLPQDRESLFYLNFSQIPALDETAREGNSLMLLMHNRLKVLFRPRGLKPAEPETQALACGLRFDIRDGQVAVENPAAFHAVVARAELVQDERRVPLVEAQVVPPFAHREWPLDETVTPGAGAKVEVILVNDYGANVRYECPWR